MYRQEEQQSHDAEAYRHDPAAEEVRQEDVVEESLLTNASLPGIPERDSAACIEDLQQADTPVLKEFVDSEASQDSRPLIDRSYSTRELYQEYRGMIRRRYFDHHYRGPNPLAYPIALLGGTIRTFSLPGFLAFKANTDGELDGYLQETANERAYEYGLNKPYAHLNQGRFSEALQSFQRALEAAPYRRAEIYRSLAHFSERVHRMQENVQETGMLDSFVLSDRFAWSDNQSGLRTSLIYAPCQSGTGLQMIQGGAVSGGFSTEHHPLDEAALIQALKETRVPWKRLAGESYLRAAHEIELRDTDPRNRDLELEVLYADAARLLSEYGDASILYADYRQQCGRHRGGIYYPDRRGEARMYADQGTYEEALLAYSDYMQHASYALDSVEHYREFFSLCKKQAAQEGESAEALMLSHLNAWSKERESFWSEMRGDYERMQCLYWRGMMHQAVGNQEEACADYETVQEDIEVFLAFARDSQGEQFQEHWEIRQDIDARLSECTR